MTRITTDRSSPFYWELHFKNPEIYLDGAVVDHVVEADTDAGYVRVVDFAPGNHPRHAGGEYLTKTLTGEVRIEEQKEQNYD